MKSAAFITGCSCALVALLFAGCCLDEADAFALPRQLEENQQLLRSLFDYEDSLPVRPARQWSESLSGRVKGSGKTGKPTFIRFGKRLDTFGKSGKPTFIRFGKRSGLMSRPDLFDDARNEQ
uniref:Uncharacterized protein n=1 Tax=Plectus sambesii TaxID=2011161 RepID=A0A914WIZ2_9BILA